MSQTKILVYGANGYTGRLIARLAADRDIDIVLAGRNGPALMALASEHGMSARVCDLADGVELAAMLDGIGVVLNCAGPFSHTFEPMAAACLQTGTHYLDITGEIAIFERAAAMDADARARGVMLLPGVGFDVVPTDCLAAHLKARLPDATELALGFVAAGGGVSHGTAATAAESIHLGAAVRIGGRITSLKHGALSRPIDYGDGRGPRPSYAIGWGDVSTAYHTTQIENVAVYTPLSRRVGQVASLFGGASWLLGTRPMQSLLRGAVDRWVKGPTTEQRQRARMYVWGEVQNESGVRLTSRVQTPEGYDFTASCALEIARRTAAGEFTPGFQTPARVYGADFILGFDGVERSDDGGAAS